jgi:hypothetical protein
LSKYDNFKKKEEKGKSSKSDDFGAIFFPQKSFV